MQAKIYTYIDTHTHRHNCKHAKTYTYIDTHTHTNAGEIDTSTLKRMQIGD